MAQRKIKPIPLERMYEVLDYDQLTGIFTWKIATSRRMKVGEVAGTVDSRGYRNIKIDSIPYAAHRLAWSYYHGKDPGRKLVDHKHGNKDDNRISELRLATDSENIRNSKESKGVCWSPRTNKWHAYITLDRKQIHLGLFFCYEKARAAYLEAKERLHGKRWMTQQLAN